MSRLGGLLVVAVAAACGHGSNDPPSDPPSDRARLEAGLANVARLADRCGAEARAELVAIAGGCVGDSACDVTRVDRELRCRALAGLGARSRVFGRYLNAAFTERGIDALARPRPRAALAVLLQDPRPWCAVPGASIEDVDVIQDYYLSPRGVALDLLWDFPVDELRPALLRARDVAEPDVVRRIDGVLRIGDKNRAQWPGPRAARIDEMVAEASPEGFERLLSFVADGMPWNDGRPEGSEAEATEVRQHVLKALDLLRLLASLELADRRDCIVAVKEAVASGRLGKRILDDFERFDVEIRNKLAEVLEGTPRAGSRAQLEELARRDPELRSEIEQLVIPALSKGGISARPSRWITDGYKRSHVVDPP